MTFREYLIAEGLHDGEDGRVEFKAAQGGVPRSMWETVSAYANSSGGRLYLGVDSEGSVIGLSDADSLQADIASALRNQLTPSIQVALSVLDLDEGLVLEVRVPEAEPYLKPVFMTRRGVRGQCPVASVNRYDREVPG